ncbi:hypothetical protein AB0F43_31975 [Kribbella sp. NPDC023972]|uniref:helix-turn-helix transcriptional regulator n=1 Tax=Kribbella sp. NPDC023972 TaxID=3154795 RepID=UPI0033EB5DA9
MRPWVVQLQWNAGDSRDEVDRLAADLASHDQVGSATQVASADGAPRLVIVVNAEDLLGALGLASSLLAHTTAASSHELGEPVSVRVVDREIHLASEATAQLPDLISASGITERLGVSKQRAHRIRQQPDFPRPVYDTGRDSLWLLSDYERYEDEHQRTPGRPRTKSDSETAG